MPSSLPSFRRYLLVVSVLLSLSPVAWAARGHGNGGSLRPLTGRQPDVRMLRENVRLYLNDEGDISALVDYKFSNEGPTQVVTMAVPENDYRNDYTATPGNMGLNNFSVHVDGLRVRAKRKIVNRQREHPEPNALLIVTVPFRQGQARHVRVRYRSHFWGTCTQFTNYMFADHKWKGQVADRKLTVVDCSREGTTQYQAGIPFRRNGRRYYYQWPTTRNPGTLDIGPM